MSKTDATTKKIREFTKFLQGMADVFDDKVARRNEIMDRLIFILNEDVALARTVYDYAVRGHLSYANQLRERLRPCPKRQ